MSVIGAYIALNGTVDAQVTRDELMAHHTSYRIGGPCALMVVPNTRAALESTVWVLEREAVPWVIMGRGSNVLVSDEGFPGCVICLGPGLSRVEVRPPDASGVAHVVAGAGAQLARVVSEAMRHSLAGLERCVGIPGTLGGAVAMDAGTRHEWIGPLVEELWCLRPGEGVVGLRGSDVEWGYRRTSLDPGEIVLGASLALPVGDHDAIMQAADELLRRRQRRQPIGKPSCGSVFKDPPSLAAGRLVEACGLKGYSVGGAQVSPVHANFVVNNGGATASDVVAVMRRMHEAVLAQEGVDLVCEVKFLGFEG